MTRILASLAIGLWVASAAVFGVVYFKSRPQMLAEERIQLSVTAKERKFVLKEMRMMLESLQGILMALESRDMASVAEAAGSSGNVMLRALPPSLMAKVPKEFRVLARDSHALFAKIEKAAKSGAQDNRIIGLLSEQLGVCTACHDTYQFRRNDEQAGP